MSAADIAINIAAQFTGKTAFDKAENSAQKLQKSVKNLGRTLGLALGTAAIVNFGKQSVKAFAEDDNAARSLAKTLENLGLNTQYAGSTLNGYISSLEQQTGVLDDELRPAMDRLLRATGSVTKSQELLGLALDISAGTGKDLTAVSQGLQKAYLGNNASLGRLGVGLSKVELNSSSFLDIQTKLTTLFAGQAKDAADSFQGSLNKLTIASNNAKEAIGEGLVEALAILTGGGGTVDGAVGTIDKMSSGIADGAKNIAYMIKQFEALKPVILTIGALLLVAFAPVVAAVAALGFILAKGGSNLKRSQFRQGAIPGGMGNVSMSVGSQDTQRAQTSARKKAEADALKLQKTSNSLKKIDNDATARKITLTADQQALEELKKKFDVERVGLFAALNQATDEETKMRLKSLIAIKDNDAALAGKIQAEIKAAQATDHLSSALYRLSAEFDMERARMAFGKAEVAGKAAAMSGAGMSGISPIASSQAALDAALKLYPDFGTEMDAARSAAARGQTNITINASGIGDQQIASVVQSAIQNLNRYGNSTTYAGAI
jgi:hypothetical protein